MTILYGQYTVSMRLLKNILYCTAFTVFTGAAYAQSSEKTERQIEKKIEKQAEPALNEPERKTKRLNADEKQVLRKQIESAGKDIYSRMSKSK